MRLTSSTRCHSSRSRRCAGPPPAMPAAVTHGVDPAVLGHRGIHRVGDRRLVPHVGLHERHVRPARGHVEILGGLGEVEAHDVRTLAHEPGDACQADPRRTRP